MNKHHHQLVFRVTREGLWLANALFRQTAAAEQLAGLLDDPARVLNVGDREDSPHKIYLFDESGLYCLYDDEANRILSVTITWLPEAEDYQPKQSFTGECWLNSVNLRSGMRKHTV